MEYFFSLAFITLNSGLATNVILNEKNKYVRILGGVIFFFIGLYIGTMYGSTL